MLTILFPLSLQLLLALPPAIPEPATIAPLQPVQEHYKRPVEVLMGSLTKYFSVVFWKGPQWSNSSEQTIRDRMGENEASIRELMKSGKLVGMASVSEDADCRMVLFFSGASEQDARVLAESSYAVKQGLLKGEVYLVWGTRGMGERLTKALQKDPNAKVNREPFYLTIVSKGKKWKENPDETMSKLMDDHASKVMLYEAKGVLRFYGAVSRNTPIRNISIIKGRSAEEVQEKLAAGELIRMRWFSAEVYPCTVPEGTLP